MDTKLPAGAHLSDEQLAQFEDGEMGTAEARHVESCVECRGRLADMQAAYAAYRMYRDVVRDPLLPAPKPWMMLDRLIEGTPARPERSFRWWPIPAFAGAVAAVVIAGLLLYNNAQTASARANRLLAIAAKSPSTRHGLISVRVHGRNLMRPAVLSSESGSGDDSGIARLQSAFVRANYDWQEPLTARAFQSWRRRLRQKRDSVSVIRTADEKESYRVRTETDTGILRSASLTLRAPDLHPVVGNFDFETEGAVEIAEAAPPANAPAPAASAPGPAAPVVETPAGPEVTLHVLAALNRIGADAGEPVDISEDAQHGRVIVHAAGLSPERLQEIATILKPLPRVAVELDSGESPRPPAHTGPAERSAANIPAPLRQQFEDRYGGAARFQEATDRVLEAGASAVAQTHALETLARDFSPDIAASFSAPDRALLRQLRDNHLTELQKLVSRIKDDLQPLLSAIPKASPPPGGSPGNWQAAAGPVVTAARKMDDALNRLLAASDGQSPEEDMLRELAVEMARLDSAMRVEQEAAR